LDCGVLEFVRLGQLRSASDDFHYTNAAFAVSPTERRPLIPDALRGMHHGLILFCIDASWLGIDLDSERGHTSRVTQT
jgi:hypothetical protein